MAIDPNQLIAAPMLQDYFVDSVTGAPLSAGVITCYQDNNRTTLKNWYYQSGSPGNYTYITLPNPMTLSAVGTIVDANGNDTIPFFYPYSETDNTTLQPYYITVDNSDGQRQFTRQNFPYVPAGQQPTNVVATNNNLICNGEFWRNIGSVTATNLTDSVSLNGTTFYYTTIAPSQHDGFTMADISFFKNDNGAVDVLTFEKFVTNFPNQILPDNITPEFYLNVACSGSGPETSKYIQIPIQLHVDSLSGITTCSAVIEAMAVSGSPSITLSIFQFLGTGVVSPAASTLITIPLGNSWQKYTVVFTMPSAQDVALGTGGDDALYLQIGFPTGTTYDINIATPAVYLAEIPPTNDFQTYDQINSIISTPRTGDVRTTLNTFYPYGWVAMNGGTIGNASSNATSRANIDTWPLFNLIWNAFSAYTSGSTNLLAQMKTSAGSNVAYGGSAIADFTANNAITLTKTMGQVILGTVPVNSLLTTYKTTFTASSSSGLLLTAANTVNFFNGMPFFVSNSGGALPTGLSANTIYYVANFNGSTTFHVSTSFANAMAGTVIAYTNAGSGTQTITSSLAGSYEGEYAHTQLVAEIATHNHGFGTHQSSAGAGGAADTFLSGQTINNVYSNPGVPIFNTGSSTPFNVTQPGVFYNIFMKL